MSVVECWKEPRNRYAASGVRIVTPLRALGVCALLLGGLLLSGCAERRGPASESSGISLGRSSGGIYRVARSAKGPNYFIVTTVGGAAGTQAGAEAAVHRTYGCQRAVLRQTQPNWRRSEGRASFCRGNPSYRKR